MMLKNKSKKGLEKAGEASSRSNSIRKTNVSSSKKALLQNNFMSASMNQSD
jgi:hypothetical protein